MIATNAIFKVPPDWLKFSSRKGRHAFITRMYIEFKANHPELSRGFLKGNVTLKIVTHCYIHLMLQRKDFPQYINFEVSLE